MVATNKRIGLPEVDAGGCVGAVRASARADVTRGEHDACIAACGDALAIGTDLRSTVAMWPRE